MMKITFKNVGQGDSIILEWVDQGKEKLIIIDCKKYNDSNPVLEYVKENENKILELLLLSHPHVDHCSGFSELIQYCIDSKKKINYFLHTSNNMPGFWKMAVTSKDAESKILELFSVIRKARNGNLIIAAGRRKMSIIILKPQFDIGNP